MKLKMVHKAPPGAIRFPIICYGGKGGTDNGLQICSLFEDVSSSTSIVVSERQSH